MKIKQKIKSGKSPRPNGSAAVAVVKKPVAKKVQKMPKAEMKNYQKLLESKREDLMHEVEKRLLEGQSTERVEVMDAADQAVDSYESELHYGINDAERRLLEDVENALSRIRDGSFGICASCGNVISKERLKAMPSARLCISCKQSQEKARVSTAS